MGPGPVSPRPRMKTQGHCRKTMELRLGPRGCEPRSATDYSSIRSWKRQAKIRPGISEGARRPCSHLDFRLRSPELRESKCVAFSPPACAALSQQPQETDPASRMPRINHVCTVAYSRGRPTVTTVYLQSFFIFPNRNSVPVKQYLLTFPPPAAGNLYHLQATFCLWIYVFWVSRIRGIMPYLSFCVWLLPPSITFSRSIHVTVWLSGSPWPDHISFLPSSTEGHRGCFHFGAGTKGTLLL